MEYVTLGRTGLKVSVAGLGCGGFSRLGLGTGKSEAEAVALVHQAFDLGVNLFDTAAVYGTEAVLGKALKAMPRDRVVIATKAWIPRGAGGSAAERAVASLDNSLRLLGIDCIDIFQLHGVSPEAYDRAREVIAPALLKEQAKGKIRHLGVTETGSSDAEHAMLQRAVEDGMWDVVMLGFHMMHQNARSAVFPRTSANRVGTLLMFAVRNIFSQPERLKSELRQLASAGKVARWLADAPNPLGFLIHAGRRRRIGDRRCLSLCAARAGGRRGVVRHRRPRAFAHQHRLDPEAAAARDRPPHPRQIVWPSGRRRPRSPHLHARPDPALTAGRNLGTGRVSQA